MVERPQECPQRCPHPRSEPCRRVSGPRLDPDRARAVQAGGAEVPTCRRRALTARTDAVDTVDQAGRIGRPTWSISPSFGCSLALSAQSPMCSALPVQVCGEIGGLSAGIENSPKCSSQEGGESRRDGPSTDGTRRPERMSRRVAITSATTAWSFSYPQCRSRSARDGFDHALRTAVALGESQAIEGGLGGLGPGPTHRDFGRARPGKPTGSDQGGGKGGIRGR